MMRLRIVSQGITLAAVGYSLVSHRVLQSKDKEHEDMLALHAARLRAVAVREQAESEGQPDFRKGK
jgi:hypothetical protein